MTAQSSPTRILSALAVAACAAMPAQLAAQDVIGEIRVTMEGEERVWQTLRSTDPSVSFNTGVTQYGPIRNISIQGYAEGGSHTRDVFVISLALMDGGGMVDQTVMYVPERMSQSWMNADDETLVTVEHLDDQSIRGTVSGRICFKDGMMTPVDTAKCRPVEGMFETRLPQAD